MTTILDPTDERVPIERSVTERPTEITGTLALLDIAKPRGNVLLDQLEAKLQEPVYKTHVHETGAGIIAS